MTEPATHQRVTTKTKIAIPPERAKSQPLQMEPQLIPDYSDTISPKIHPYDGKTCNVPLVHIYNTNARSLKGGNIMTNQMTKIAPHRQISTPAPNNTIVNSRRILGTQKHNHIRGHNAAISDECCQLTRY